MLACLSRRRSSVQIRSGTLSNMARYANPAERRSSNLRGCGFDSLPCYLKQHASAGHWRAQVAVTHPPSGCGGSTPSRRTDNMARSSSGQGCETLILATWVRFPYGSLTTIQHSQVAELVDTRRSERRARKACEFDSRLGYLTLQVRQVSNRLSYGRCARLDTETCNLTRVGQCSSRPHKPGLPGATPGPAT